MLMECNIGMRGIPRIQPKGVTMVDYRKLRRLTAGKSFPVAARNENGENVIIARGNDPAFGSFFKLTIAQSNGWVRTNIVYENGTMEESYGKQI